MHNKDFFYHCIDWGIAIIAIIIPLIYSNYLLVYLIILIAVGISLVVVLQCNKRLKKEINIYESILRYPIPLYGLLNYIFSQKGKKSIYLNQNFHLDELSLKIKVTGNLLANKNNDLEFNWSFIGSNEGSKDSGEFNLRIGGDSATPFDKLKVQCVDCSIKCGEKGSICSCVMEKECLEKYSPYFTIIDIISSKTLYLLNINLINKVKPNNKIKLKISYVWPQCYNYNSDFVLIDPNNFAKKIKNLRITVAVDKVVIKSISKVQLFSLDTVSNEIESEGQVPLLPNQSAFERKFEVAENKIYFATIQNM